MFYPVEFKVRVKETIPKYPELHQKMDDGEDVSTLLCESAAATLAHYLISSESSCFEEGDNRIKLMRDCAQRFQLYVESLQYK